MKPAAIIFDLDGTLIDNNAYHIEAWKAFHHKIGRPFSLEEYKTTFNGKINRDIFHYIFQRKLSAEEIEQMTEEKESLYRELYAPHIEPVPGLIDFLDELYHAGIPMAVATSGLPVNIQFMFDRVSIEKYFVTVVNSTHVSKGKPDPEIFLKAADFLDADPGKSIAFEDSVSGVVSAKAAGMKVVGLVTTHAREDLDRADLIIKDYTEINFQQLQQLFDA